MPGNATDVLKAIEAMKFLKDFCINHENCTKCPLARKECNGTCAMSYSISGIPAMWQTKNYEGKP